MQPSKGRKNFDARPRTRQKNSGRGRKRMARGTIQGQNPANEGEAYIAKTPTKAVFAALGLDSCWGSCSGSDQWTDAPPERNFESIGE